MSMLRNLVLVLCVGFIGMAIPAHAESEMTIEEAYRAMNHKRTPFDKTKSNLKPAEVKYLDHLFFVTDLVFRERMIMLRHFHAGTDELYIMHYNGEIDNLLESFNLVSAPTADLEEVVEILIEAIRQQQEFFIDWNTAKGTPRYDALNKHYISHTLIKQSHTKLLQVYGVLLKNYGHESTHNKQSFYDHLCVLDFI